MENPKQDEGSQQGNQNQQKKGFNSYKDSFVCYNNKCASIRFGFVYHSPYVQIAAVLENMKGKRPVGGVQMYDNDHNITFQFNLDELFFIKTYWKDIVSGELDPIMFIHDNKNDSNKKVFMMGKGLDDENPDKVAIAISINPTQRTGQIIFDEPIQSILYIPEDVDLIENKKYLIHDIDKIRVWFDVAIQAKMNTACDKQPFNRGNYNNGGEGKPKFNYGRGSGNYSPRSDRPVVSRFGSNNKPINDRPNQVKEDAEDVFDVDDSDVMG